MPRWMSFEGEVALLEGVFAGILCSLFLRFGTVSTPKNLLSIRLKNLLIWLTGPMLRLEHFAKLLLRVASI